MYVVSGCKGRDLTLQGGVIHVTFMLQSSFFCLETKERSKEKFKADFFLLLAPFTSLKGRNSLRSNSLPFLTLRYGRSPDGEKSRPGKLAGWALLLVLWGRFAGKLFWMGVRGSRAICLVLFWWAAVISFIVLLYIVLLCYIESYNVCGFYMAKLFLNVS